MAQEIVFVHADGSVSDLVDGEWVQRVCLDFDADQDPRCDCGWLFEICDYPNCPCGQN